MKLKDEEKDLLEVFKGVAESALSLIPVVGQMYAGYEAHNKYKFEKNVTEVLKLLKDKVDNPGALFSEEWCKSEEGQKFCRKVLDAALDDQLTDKQELFINALIHGITNKNLSELEKLKFVDMLRHLSRASLMILADMHKLYSNKLDSNSGILLDAPLIQLHVIVAALGNQYDPYLIESCFDELKAVGLFSPTVSYDRTYEGIYRASRSYSEGNLTYTKFTAKFVEFITFKEILKLT
jgi:hypothetical protein